MLLEACRLAGDSHSILQIQASVERLGIIALAPRATAVVQGLARQFENGGSGEGVVDARQLWSELHYRPQLQALPWAFLQRSSREEQERMLQQHAEKKALTVLVSHGEAELNVSINFNACMDCHEFFKVSSQLLRRKILLCQPKMTHTFADGHCSCNDWWRWEARLAIAGVAIAAADEK